MENFNWKTDLFRRRYEVTSSNQLLGLLTHNCFSNNSMAIIDKERYKFKFVNYFRQEVAIINKSNETQIGRIKISCWGSRASITLNDKSYQWSFSNWWQKNWSISSTDGLHTTAHTNKCDTAGGLISDNLLLGFSGLFISNYLKNITILTACIVPSLFFIGIL